MHNALVSIALINWNGIDDTILCLESLKKLKYKNIEIIVVDNGSKDNSVEKLEEISGIKLIKLPRNTGFTGGHIAALNAAIGEYILLINNDLIVDSEWIDKALETFKNHPDCAAVGGKLYKWNKSNPVGSKENEYYSFADVNERTGNTYTNLVGEIERPVDAVSGAALMIKRACLEKTGYLDDDFFAYYEETDLIARLYRAGYKVYYNPLAVAWHKIAASSRGGEASDFYLYSMHRNRYIFAYKNFDDKYLKIFLRNYRTEIVKAFLGAAKGEKDSKNKIKAYSWIVRNRRLVTNKRKETMSLGNSYIPRIREYDPKDVTIVIPCYNYEKYVGEAIDSALRQTVKPSQIIIINDGSTDNSLKTIKTYKDKPNIKIIDKTNSGVVDTKNLGIKLSNTYWTIFLDADDILDDHYLEKTINLANQNRYDIVYTDMEYFGAFSDIFRSKDFNIFSMLQRNFVHNSALIKTSFLKQSGGYKNEMRGGLEDWELYLTLYELGARFGHLKEVIFKYRQHDGSLSRNRDVQVNKEQQLYGTIINLHQRTFKHMNPARRKTIRALRLLLKFIAYPSLFGVVLVNFPGALKASARHILHKIREHISSKEKI